MHHDTSSQRRADRGFTLVELLIVIVILGILATVTVFAVRGITDKGQENAEGTDLDTIETAIDAYWLDERNNPTEAELVSAGYLKDQSALHDIVVAGDGSYTITNVRTGATASSGQAGGNAPTAPAATTISGTPVNIAGMTGYSVGTGPAVVWIGGANTRAIWNAAVDAGRPVAQGGGATRLIFMDSAQFGGLSNLAAFATQEGVAYTYSWVVDADDTPDFCQIPDGMGGTNNLTLSECATQGRIDVNVPDPFAYRVWQIGQVDRLFAAN